MIMTKIKKKIGKNIINKIIKLKKVHAMMALTKTLFSKKPQKVFNLSVTYI